MELELNNNPLTLSESFDPTSFGVKTELRLVTPNVAREMLKRNRNNRRLKPSNVTKLRKEIRSNNWVFDGMPIRFDKSGNLLDGQHRLTALIKENKSLMFLIVSGIGSQAFKVMDTGSMRNGVDALAIEGVEYSQVINSAIRTIMKLRSGSFSSAAAGASPSNTDIINFYNDNKVLSELASSTNKLTANFNFVLSASSILSLAFMFRERNVDDAEKFMSKLCTGLGLDEGSPILILRNILIKDKLSDKKMTPKLKYHYIFKTWNYYRKGKKVSALRKPDTDKPLSII